MCTSRWQIIVRWCNTDNMSAPQVKFIVNFASSYLYAKRITALNAADSFTAFYFCYYICLLLIARYFVTYAFGTSFVIFVVTLWDRTDCRENKCNSRICLKAFEITQSVINKIWFKIEQNKLLQKREQWVQCAAVYVIWRINNKTRGSLYTINVDDHNEVYCQQSTAQITSVCRKRSNSHHVATDFETATTL